MLSNYTAKYIKISSDYTGQLVEWPEVITEGKTLEECREMLKDALCEMIAAYRQQNKEIPKRCKDNPHQKTSHAGLRPKF